MDTDEARYQKISHALFLCTRMTKKNTVKQKNCRVKRRRFFSQINDNILLKAVNFILSEENCISTSCDTKIVQLLEDESIQLPQFQRKRSIIDIINAYLKPKSDEKNQLSQRLMFMILNFITSKDQASLYAIDYVMSLLVNKAAEVIQGIFVKLVPSKKAKNASKLVTVAS